MSTEQATCECGCGQSPKPGRRFLHGHNRRKALAERFWSKVEETSTCWLWRGYVAENGYGHCGRSGAHRVAYELLVGPIPDGLTIDHLCFNKACVNPTHLEPVTGQENQARAFALITHCPQGHEYTPENMLRGRRECRQCNREAALRRYHQRRAAA